MNRISRRSADEAAEALLEAGRTEPVLHYDVESGLERHHHWLRSDAPLPEWASASVGLAAKSSASVVVKTLVSAVLVSALGVVAWQALDRPQPSAAAVKPSSPAAESTSVPTSDSEPPKPLPVPDHVLPSDHTVSRSVRAEVPDKRTPRVQRAHKAPASVHAVLRTSAPAEKTPARVAPAAPEQAPSTEVASAPERKSISAAQPAPPKPAPRAQTADDLAEMQQVAAAEQLLERSPERALALVRQGDQRFAGGYFRQERAYIATMALIRLGRLEEARARAASFAKQFPALPYGARIRSALEAQEAAAR